MTTGADLFPAIFAAGPVAVAVERDVIRVSGPDAVKYLEGQLSQAIGPLEAGQAAWSFLLQPQGKVDAWLRVSSLGEQDLLLDLDAGAGAQALARLQRFLLRTDCAFSLERWSTVSVRGPGAGDMAIDAVPGALVVVPAQWPGIDGADALGPVVSMPAGVAVASEDDLEGLRIACGVPAMGREIHEGLIPAEAGVVGRSVSFTKGCYTGQELVARIDSRGNNVPRLLRGVLVAGPAVPGDDLHCDGAVVGKLTSVADAGGRSIALAYVKRGVDVPREGTVGGCSAEVFAVGS